MKRFGQKYNIIKKPVDQPGGPAETFNMDEIMIENSDSSTSEVEMAIEDVAVIELAAPITFKQTVIEAGAVVNGDMTLEGDLVVFGQINGNVVCKSSLKLSGKILGDVACHSAELDDGVIIGNLKVQERAHLGKGMSIKGDMTARVAMVEGKIMGKCTMSNGLLHLHETGAVVGDVVTSRLIIDDSAIIQGAITVNRDVCFDLE